VPSVKMKEVSVLALTGRSVLNPDFVGPVIKGDGDMSYICCGCDQVLLERVGYKQVAHL